MLPIIWNYMLAGILYSIGGWLKNFNAEDAKKRDFNWIKLGKNILIGLILGAVTFLFFPDKMFQEVIALPYFIVIQAIVDHGVRSFTS